jgi:hypothetical protein
MSAPGFRSRTAFLQPANKLLGTLGLWLILAVAGEPATAQIPQAPPGTTTNADSTRELSDTNYLPPSTQLSSNPASATNVAANVTNPPIAPSAEPTTTTSTSGVPSERSTLWFIAGALAALGALVIAGQKQPKGGPAAK